MGAVRRVIILGAIAALGAPAGVAMAAESSPREASWSDALLVTLAGEESGALPGVACGEAWVAGGSSPVSPPGTRCPTGRALAHLPDGSIVTMRATLARLDPNGRIAQWRVRLRDGLGSSVGSASGLDGLTDVATSSDGRVLAIWDEGLSPDAGAEHLLAIDAGGTATRLARRDAPDRGPWARVTGAPNGGAIVADGGSLLRVSRDGTSVPIMGAGQAVGGDVPPRGPIGGASGMLALADGSVLVSDARDATLRRIGPEGIVTTIAGGGGATATVHRRRMSTWSATASS
jgi:hypothetical protein